MTSDRRIAIWTGLFLVFGLVLYLLNAILLPFVAGMAVAYFLDPVADWLERRKLSRTLATTIILAGFFVVAVGLLLMLFPLLQSQVVGLLKKMPTMVMAAREMAEPYLATVKESLEPDQAEGLRSAVADFAGAAVKWVGGLLGKAWRGGAALVDMLSMAVITPLVAFYLIRDWDRLVAKVDSWIPLDARPTVHEQFAAIDETLSGFVRGQATVCLALGTIYAFGLTLVGLQFGLLVGLMAGLVSFIPYFGAALGVVVAFGLALLQGFDALHLGGVALVFAVGQTLESFFLTPKLVGDRVGLHPVWVIFALLAGGALFGFTGVLLGVPVAAVVGVLARFALERYKESPLYLGGGEEP